MLSRRTRSALAAMLDIACLARGKPIPAKSLAPPDGLAPRQLETVLQDLVRAGLLRSIRGPLGGYELARERRRISAGDIVRAIEDLAPPGASGGSGAVIELAITEATGAFLRRLDEVSLEDLRRRTEPDETGVTDFDI